MSTHYKIIHPGEAMSKSNHYQICVPKGGGKPFMYIPTNIKKYGLDLAATARQVVNIPLAGPVRIDVYAYFGTCRRKDVQNTLKTLCDALNNVAYEDDSQIVELHAYKRLDKENPRVEIHVTNLPISDTYPLTSCQSKSKKRKS